MQKPTNLTLDPELVMVGRDYARMNPREKSLSDLVQRLLVKHLASRVRKHGLKLPEHLVTK